MPPIRDLSPRPPFNAGLALWEQRDHVAAASDLLRRLLRLVGRPTDLTPFQWGQLFAAAIDFAPSLILELGRGCGNSTCVFATAAAATEARVVSVCLSDSWRTATRGRVAGVVPPSWLARLDTREADITTLDFDEILGQAPRVLVFWDAHGYEIADHVLGRLLPAMAGREQLVLMHDLSDARYEGGGNSGGYGEHALWRGTSFRGPRIRLGHIDSAVEQAVAIVDFTSRNHLTLRSAAEDLHDVIGRHPSRVEALQGLLGELFDVQAHWFHFSPSERVGPLSFPAVSRPGTAAPGERHGHTPSQRAPVAEAPAATTAPARPRLVTRARHRQSIELIVTGRTDDHGGPEFFDRFCAAARHNHAVLSAAGIPHSFTLVEWNPLPDRPLLSDAVTRELPFWDRCWVVDPAWHAALSENPRLRFMEFFAKNAAARRSTADLVLTTNSDVFLSTELVEQLGSAPLLDDHVYRAVRHDVDRAVDWRHGGEPVLADPRRHVRVNAIAAPDYGNASGDFLLLTRATFTRLRGFNEVVRYAKIHKDGQFCWRAVQEGLVFVPLGPVWHIDHDGSYANMGVQKGSPEAHYGPEWDWRQPYRNPASWGLSAAIADPRDDKTVWLRHPQSHGPTLSVVPASDRAQVAEGIAAANGRYLLVHAPADLTSDERLAIERLCEDAQPERAVFAGACVRDPVLGALPAPGAPLLIARRPIDRPGGWPEHASDPALTWWLAQGGGPAQVVDWPSARALAVAATLPASTRILALRDRGDAVPAPLWHEAGLEYAESTTRMTQLLAAWTGGLGLQADARIGVCGPDWATPGILTALERAGLAVAGAYTQAAGQVGSLRWGVRLRALDRVIADGITDLLAVGLDTPIVSRLEREGYAGRVHQLLDPAPAGAHPDLPAEIEYLRAAVRAATTQGDVATATDRLAALATLAGAERWDHTYDAAAGWDRMGRPDEALRLFEAVVAGEGVAPALRNRARFHAGRLHLQQGAHDAARLHLTRLIAEVPDHLRGAEYLASLPAVATESADA